MITNCQKTWHRGVRTHFISPMVLLLWFSSVSSHGSCPDCYPMASIGWDIYPSAKHMWSCRHPIQLQVTWSLYPSSVDALVDVHGRSHSFPLIHYREVFLAWCWVIYHKTIIFLWHSFALTPLGNRLNWGGAGTSVPYLADIHTQGNTVSDATRRS